MGGAILSLCTLHAKRVCEERSCCRCPELPASRHWTGKERNLLFNTEAMSKRKKLPDPRLKTDSTYVNGTSDSYETHCRRDGVVFHADERADGAKRFFHPLSATPATLIATTVPVWSKIGAPQQQLDSSNWRASSGHPRATVRSIFRCNSGRVDSSIGDSGEATSSPYTTVRCVSGSADRYARPTELQCSGRDVPSSADIPTGPGPRCRCTNTSPGCSVPPSSRSPVSR